MSKSSILFLALVIFSGDLMAQKINLQQTVLWEVRSPVTKKVSYLFGTVHLFGGSWLDSITLVKDKFLKSKHVLVEVKAKLENVSIDSFKKPYNGPPVLPRKLFSEKLFPIVNNYTKSIGWGDIDTLFKQNPQPVLTMIGLNWQLISDYTSRFHLIKPGEDNLDSFIANKATAAGKVVTALDDKTEIILNLGKKQDPEELAKNIEELVFLLQAPKDIPSTMYTDVLAYKNLNYKYHFDENAPEEGEKGGIDGTRRNNLWMPKLINALREGDCFVAVGIAHLNYKHGLINQLKAAGFEITPVQVKRTSDL
jgi:uncharacterized protein YbaP (TraB family)